MLHQGGGRPAPAALALVRSRSRIPEGRTRRFNAHDHCPLDHRPGSRSRRSRRPHSPRETGANRKGQDTLLYLVFVPDMHELSLPTASPLEVVFVEGYKNKTAFLQHLNGPVFTHFTKKHQALFLSTTVTGQDGKPVQSPFVLFKTCGVWAASCVRRSDR